MSRRHARRQKSLEEIITPIVEGQLRTYGQAHPGLVEAVDWRHSHPTKLDAFVASGAKRITTALLCDQSVLRMRSAILVGEQSSPGCSTGDGQPVSEPPATG